MRLLTFAVALLVLLGGLPPSPARAAGDLFFSEYIEGSSNNKALEIFNGTGASVDLAAGQYRVEMYFNGSTTPGLIINLTGTVANGDVFVLAHSSAAAAILAQADQTNGSGWFNGNDAVVLRKGPAAGTVVDSIGRVGVDPGTEWGTGPTSTADNTLRRKTAITAGDTIPNDAFAPSTEWDGVATDLIGGLGSHRLPFVEVTTPANNATGVATNANIVITFGEPVTLSGTPFTLSCATTGAHTLAVSGGPTTYTLDPSPDFTFSESCTLTVVAANVKDTDDTPDAMPANYLLAFTIAGPPQPGPDRIRDIQGAAHRSPKAGSSVTNVPGIVTAKRSNGFWFQDPIPDSNDATSEALLVFTSSAPTVNVGDSVLVSGTVTEFRPGGTSSTNLTTTEITSPSITVLSNGNSLPAPVVIGTHRTPPSQVIEDDATGSVETSGTFDPATDGIDFYESLEGMRVQVNGAVVVGPTNGFGEIWVLANNGAGASVRTERGGIIVRPGDFNPERIQIDDDLLGPAPKVNVGDHITGPIVGVIDYNFGNFELLNTSPLTGIVSDGVQRESTTLQGTANQVTVGTFNVENLDPGDGPAKFNALAQGIVSRLGSPDIVVLEEVQDNNGPANDAVVAADATLNALISAIQGAGGPTYQFRQINPVDDADGGEPGGNIRVAFLFNPARVTFVDRPGGGSTTATTVSAGAPGVPQLSASPGRIDPTNAAFTSSRKPLVGEFTFNGRTIFVVGNHFNSKGGDQPLFGRFQPPTLTTEAQRQAQATIVRDFVRQILQIDPNARVVVAGDLNDFAFSAPLQTLKSTPLVALIESLDDDEEYSYVFEGNSQTLDHILASNALNAALAGYDVVRFNAEFAEQDSDHDPQVARFLIDATPPTVTCSINLSSLWPPNHRMVPGVLTVNVSDAGSGPDGWKLVSVTSNEPDAGTGPEDVPNDIQGWSVGTDDTAGDLRAERSESGTGRIYSIVVEGRDKQGNTAPCTAVVEVPHDQGGKKP